MKWLIDAQLPMRIVEIFGDAGQDALHTRQLPEANATSDETLRAISVQQQRIIDSKDADLVHSYWLRRSPWKLLLISTGNISNQALRALLGANLTAVLAAFMDHAFVELHRDGFIIHD